MRLPLVIIVKLSSSFRHRLDIFAGWRIFVIAAVIVAIVTFRYSSVHETLVTITAIKLGVDIIKLQAGYGVLEIGLVPATVAIGAFRAERANFPAGRVTGTTTQTLVEPV
jgi:hypothetical protein